MPPKDKINRRTFVASSLAALGTSSLLALPGNVEADPVVVAPHTVQSIIDLFLKEIPSAPFEKTVDTLKAGSPDQVVTGIVTTMFATVDVIKKAIALKANFIIAHEPTFYNHLDETGWLEENKVYAFKRDLLQKNGIAVWRNHDYIHSHQPDGVLMGFLTDLGWEKYYDADHTHVVTLPSAPLSKIVEHLKDKLKIPHVRVVGSLSQPCQRIAFTPGAAGGKNQIALMQKEQPDVLIVGEVSEWETAEYARDAQAMESKPALIVLGHAQSEESGLTWLTDWLKTRLPILTVTHIPAGNPFTWV
jgi:putative NIF3 family GTP cyclohydrolase 1 type 2